MRMDRLSYIVNLGLLSVLLLAVLSACNFTPAPETLAPGQVETSAAQTIAVNMQQATIAALEAQLTAQAQTLQAPTVPPTPTLPPTQAPPTPTPTGTPLPPTLPPTLAPPTAALPTQALMLSASVETRCRQGPNPAFPVISYIRVGQQAQVIGQNPEGTWWLIQDPQGQFGNCWVWGETTQALGEASLAPVVQPPPLPTQAPSVNFSLAYDNIHVCGGVAVITFRVGNNGNAPFQSSSITIRDVTNNSGLSGPESSNTPFVGSSSSCAAGSSLLPPGSSAYVLKGMGFLPASGTKGRGIVVLCTQPSLAGACVEQKVNFTFP